MTLEDSVNQAQLNLHQVGRDPSIEGRCRQGLSLGGGLGHA